MEQQTTQHNKTWDDIYLTYTGLLEGNGGGGFPQGVDCRHINFVREAGEDFRKMYTTAILVVRVFLHLQWTLVMSGEEDKFKRLEEREQERLRLTSF